MPLPCPSPRPSPVSWSTPPSASRLAADPPIARLPTASALSAPCAPPVRGRPSSPSSPPSSTPPDPCPMPASKLTVRLWRQPRMPGRSDHHRPPQAGQPARQMRLPHLRLRRSHRAQMDRPGRTASLPPAWADAGGGSCVRPARVGSGGDTVTAVASEAQSILSGSLFDPPEATSMARGVPRPDAFRRLRRAAEGKGGAAWRRDRTRAQPRVAAAWQRAWRARGARGGPAPYPQRAPRHCLAGHPTLCALCWLLLCDAETLWSKDLVNFSESLAILPGECALAREVAWLLTQSVLPSCFLSRMPSS